MFCLIKVFFIPLINEFFYGILCQSYIIIHLITDTDMTMCYGQLIKNI